MTTTALALTLVWPRPTVLFEADVSGSSSVAVGYLRGTLAPQRGLINLAVAHRAGTLGAESVREQAVALTDDESRWLVPGLADQVGSMTVELWDRVGATLTAVSGAGTDVIVDAGRAGAVNGPQPLLRQADMVLLVARTSLDAVVSARARVGQMRAAVADAVRALTPSASCWWAIGARTGLGGRQGGRLAGDRDGRLRRAQCAGAQSRPTAQPPVRDLAIGAKHPQRRGRDPARCHGTASASGATAACRTTRRGTRRCRTSRLT